MKYQVASNLLISLTVVSAFVAPRSWNQNTLRAFLAEECTTKPIYDPLGLYPESSEERQQGRIQVMETPWDPNRKIRDPLGLYPKNSPEFLQALQEEQERIAAVNEKPLFDPMNLYTANTPERQNGLIRAMETPIETAKDTTDPMGLYPKGTEEFMVALELERESLVSKNRDLFDPLGLYPSSSPERSNGTIKTLEPKLKVVKSVTDPMGLYSTEQLDEVDTDAVMSEALPFAHRPSYLDGNLAGDAGFDPLGFAKSKDGLLWQRQAELKHSRIAMLAAAGWPTSELFHKKIASFLHLKSLLVDGDRVPSLLNGGLQHTNPFYWMGILAVTGLFEGIGTMRSSNAGGVFDPLKLFPEDQEGRKRMEVAELKNGRLAMLAIASYAIIEAVSHKAVVENTQFLFHPWF